LASTLSLCFMLCSLHLYVNSRYLFNVCVVDFYAVLS
jgi:hypothetical protein